MELHLEQQQQTTTTTNNDDDNNKSTPRSSVDTTVSLKTIRWLESFKTTSLFTKRDFSVAAHLPLQTTCTLLLFLFPASATHSCFPPPHPDTSELPRAPHSWPHPHYSSTAVKTAGRRRTKFCNTTHQLFTSLHTLRTTCNLPIAVERTNFRGESVHTAFVPSTRWNPKHETKAKQ